jgi:hypothetical protein
MRRRIRPIRKCWHRVVGEPDMVDDACGRRAVWWTDDAGPAQPRGPDVVGRRGVGQQGVLKSSFRCGVSIPHCPGG